MTVAATQSPAPSAHPTRELRNGDRGSCAVREASLSRPFRSIALRSAAEIESIRAAGALAAAALDAARRACVAGVMTSDIDLAAEQAIRQGGGEPLFLGYRGSAARADGRERPAYPASTCISINEELVHGVPGMRMVRSGDLVAIDVGVRLDGWCADTATTVAVDRVASERLAMLACAERMLAHAVAAIAPGRRWSRIAAELESIAEDAGYAIAADFVGHGIGRSLHEAPQVPCTLTKAYLEHHDFTLRPGMVIAIEPMLVLEAPRRIGADAHLVNPSCRLAGDGWTVTVDSGAPSCHVEHTVVVTRDGAEVLTLPAGAGCCRRRAG
jgi:methionyl aminopeptidase